MYNCVKDIMNFLNIVFCCLAICSAHLKLKTYSCQKFGEKLAAGLGAQL